MKNTFKIGLIALFGFISFQMSAQNPTFSIQSTLKNITGEAIPDGEQTIIFKLYTQEEGGTSLWTETADVEVVSGIYSHELGSVTPLNNNDFGNQLYLGVTVSGKELSPRTKLGYAPYALAVNSIASNGESAGFNNMGNFVVSGPLSASNITDDLTVDGTITATDIQLTNKPVVFATAIPINNLTSGTLTELTPFSDSLYVVPGDIITVDVNTEFAILPVLPGSTSDYFMVFNILVESSPGCNNPAGTELIRQVIGKAVVKEFKQVSTKVVFVANCTGAYSFGSVITAIENGNDDVNFQARKTTFSARRN